MGDLYRPGAILDYPVGGSGAVIDALVRGIERHGGTVRLSTHVERINVDESGRAVGVTLRGGEVLQHAQSAQSDPLGTARARLLHLLRACLRGSGRLGTPRGGGQATMRPATASGARASRLPQPPTSHGL